jgi:hypothetical protein
VVHSEEIEADGLAQSGAFTLPPLSTSIFKWTAGNGKA